MENYSNLVDAINGLRKQGYTEDFNLHPDCIKCKNRIHTLSPQEFIVDKYFRFEDDTDPTDQSIIYAISSTNSKLKGILVNGYGVYSDSIANELIEKLKISK